MDAPAYELYRRTTRRLSLNPTIGGRLDCDGTEPGWALCLIQPSTRRETPPGTVEAFVCPPI